MADLPTLAVVNALVSYDPETGIFSRNISRAGYEVGSRAGTVNAAGYRIITISGKSLREHRLAYFIMTGEWPSEGIDHKDRNRQNNAWGNLRTVSRTENQHNQESPKPNPTGFQGVKLTRSGKFEANIQLASKKYCLGTFDTPEEAHTAYLESKTLLVGDLGNGLEPPKVWEDFAEFSRQ